MHLQQRVVRRVAAEKRLPAAVKALQLHFTQLVILVNGQQLRVG